MGWDDFQNLVELERERRKTDREREIEREIAAIAAKHKRSLDAELAPLMKELTEIEARKPPLPILHEGNIYQYIGPCANQ